jgi:hypothetical protein
MMRLFCVIVHYVDGAHNQRRVYAVDDIEARAKAIIIERESVQLAKDFATATVVPVDYCEIDLVRQDDNLEEVRYP